MRELEVVGVRLDVAAAPILLLREVGGRRCLPIWIGAGEASAIVNGLEQVKAPRPLTHDLIVSVFEQLAISIKAGRITGMDDGTFHAELQVNDVWVDARPSDVVALAVRTGVGLQCPDELLEEVGVVLDESPGDDELEKFREFLDSVTPEDFDGGEASTDD